ncbi:MAG: TVP38/TMEM64 family protein [Mogibacterium sp.]|nr:TVP38/TMEM64 family protein [Mogibacterium sp.]
MEDRKKASAIFKLILLVLFLVGVPAVLYINFSDTLFSIEWLRHLPELLKQYKGHTEAVLMGLQILQVVICIIPGQPIQFAGSYMFGIILGYLISIIGAVIGAFIAFYIAKLLGKDSLGLFFDQEKIEDYHRKLNSGRGLTAVLLIYLIPGIPKDLVAYVAGISNMRVRPFLVVSTIGRSPGMIGSLLLGYFTSRHNYTAIVILAAATAVILIICFIYRSKLVSLLDDLEKKDEERHTKG